MSRTRAELSDAPEQLSDEDRAWLRAWTGQRYPEQVRHLRELEEACLMHFAASGKRMKSWKLTCANWVRNDRRFSRRGPYGGAEGPVRPSLPLYEPRVDDAAAELARRREANRIELIKERTKGPLATMIQSLIRKKP